MALARTTVWNDDQVLTHTALNGEFDPIVNYVNVLEVILDSVKTRTVSLKAIPDATALTTGDGKYTWVVPEEYNSMFLATAAAHVFTASSSGLPTIQVARDRSGAVVDMLSTRITIDVSEKDSATAATLVVIDAANRLVQTGDVIRIDVDVAGTSTAGLEVRLGFRAV